MKYIWQENRQNMAVYMLISFASSCVINFPENKFQIKNVITKHFLNDIFNLMVRDDVIHHSHVTGEIIDYAHNLSNKK